MGYIRNIVRSLLEKKTHKTFDRPFESPCILVLHKIQDFQESCLGLVLQIKTRPRQDCYTQDQDQDKIKNVKTKTRQD